MTQTRLDFYVEESIDGKVVIRYTGNVEEEGRGPGLRVFNNRQELADYIDPRKEPSQYDIALKIHKEEQESIDKAEAEKAKHPPVPPPYPSNQANMQSLLASQQIANYHPVRDSASINANAFHANGGSFNMGCANLGSPAFSANNYPEWMKQHEAKRATDLNKLSKEDPVKYLEEAAKAKEIQSKNQPKPVDLHAFMTEAIRVGYSGRIGDYITDLTKAKIYLGEKS